ncbi:MAG: hypothetical protein ABIP74_04720 [Candidatus Saccharimonas sp.]
MKGATVVSLFKTRWMIVRKKHVRRLPFTRRQVDQMFPDMPDGDKILLVGLEPEEEIMLSDDTTVRG